MASSVPPPREGSGPHGVVYAEEVDVPNALERLWSTLFGDSEAFRLKRRALLMRALQMLFGLLAVVLSTCYDLPRAVPVRVKRDGFVLIDAGVISSMFAFPAYVYLTTIAVITFVGSMLFALLLLVDLSLVGGSSEHESVRYKIDNNAPYLALCFDFIFLILATTSACASFGLTNVMHMSLDYGAMSFAPKIERVFETIFDFKYVASACMFAQSIFIGATLVLTYQHIEERQTQMTLLGIPPTATQQSIDFIFRFYKTFSSGVGRRSEDRAAISPLFVNRVVQVLLSLACFVVCYDIIDWTEQELKFVFVPAFHVITWVSLALFIISSGIAGISAVDFMLTGGVKKSQGQQQESQEYKGIVQSSSAQFKENLIYARIIYDSLASLLTFCTFAAASGVTSARLNCSAGDKLWCPLSALGVFFAFMLSISFMISLFTGSYVSFREHRMKAVVSSIVK